MNEATLFFWSVALAFAVLLALEWRYRLRTLRIGAAVLAVTMLFFFAPHYHAAWRRAMGTPPSERITAFPGTVPGSVARSLSEYESGVFTMHRAVVENAGGYVHERRLALGVLFWLACSPALRGIGPHWRRAFPRRTAGDGEVEG
jgi:hypothetical protein